VPFFLFFLCFSIVSMEAVAGGQFKQNRFHQYGPKVNKMVEFIKKDSTKNKATFYSRDLAGY